MSECVCPRPYRRGPLYFNKLFSCFFFFKFCHVSIVHWLRPLESHVETTSWHFAKKDQCAFYSSFIAKIMLLPSIESKALWTPRCGRRKLHHYNTLYHFGCHPKTFSEQAYLSYALSHHELQWSSCYKWLELTSFLLVMCVQEHPSELCSIFYLCICLFIYSTSPRMLYFSNPHGHLQVNMVYLEDVDCPYLGHPSMWWSSQLKSLHDKILTSHPCGTVLNPHMENNNG